MYAIIDIETTGLSPGNEKITEIAIFIHDGKKVVNELVSLVNPEKKIPYRIISITGINNQMVEGAPKFYEIAKQIVEITQDCILVGHNVRFDYGFLRHEFLSFGYAYERKTIDTIKLARKLVPGRKSYSLGELCADLDINNTARHRAAGDALATVKLFEMFLAIDPNPENLNLRGMNVNNNKDFVSKLPEKAGVYYFYDSSKELIYVGKSVNIRDRVMSHLNNNLHKKAIEMKSRIADVSCEITGSELVALLLESEEIKINQPRYNQAQKRTYFNYGLYTFTDENDYCNLKVMRIVNELTPIYTYSSLNEAKEHVASLCEEYNLCQKLCGIYDTSGACFYYQIHKCKGACIGEESAASYNSRVEEAMDNYQFKKQNFFVIDRGRHQNEQSVVKIQHGKYIGFGYVENNEISTSVDILNDCITQYRDNKEVRRIILSFLKKHKCEIVEY